MKLVTFVQKPDHSHIGALVDDKILDLTRGTKGAEGIESAIHDMVEWIRRQDQTMPAAEKVIADFKEGRLKADYIFEAGKVELKAPIPRPTSCRDAYAFRQHVEAARRNRGVEMIPEFDEFPVFYFTNHLAINGPGEMAVEERALEKLDFELEVAIVIGREGRNLKASEADDHIFGYCIMNDWSARALQMKEMKMSLGPAKGKDFATTLGPYLVTRDELADLAIPSEDGERHDLRMRCWVNDKLLSDGNAKDISYPFGRILERISYGVTIHPGEVIGSGTVGSGCLLELNGSKITDNQWIKPGDKVVMEIDRLGRLENTIVASTAGAGLRV